MESQYTVFVAAGPVIDAQAPLAHSELMTPDHYMLRVARNELKMTAHEAAQAVGLGRSQLLGIEGGTEAADPEVITRLTAFYEAAGIIFGAGPGVQLRPGLQRPGGKQVN